jgi:prepilin-type processing-associated H-X9-DG protein
MNFFSALYWSPYYNTNPLASGNEYGPGTFDCNFKNNVFNCIGAPGSMMDESTNTLIGWEHLSRVPVCNFLQVHDWYENPPNNAALEEHFHFLHRNGANTMWGDGHSKHITYGKMKRRFFSLRKDIYPN